MTIPVTASLGLTTAQNMDYFYSVLTWAMGQAAPWIMLLFAVSVAGWVAWIIRRSLLSAIDEEEDPYFEEDDE